MSPGAIHRDGLKFRLLTMSPRSVNRVPEPKSDFITSVRLRSPESRIKGRDFVREKQPAAFIPSRRNFYVAGEDQVLNMTGADSRNRVLSHGSRERTSIQAICFLGFRREMRNEKRYFSLIGNAMITYTQLRRETDETELYFIDAFA